MDHAAARAILDRLHAAQNAMYAGGDLEPVTALLTDDIEWHVPGRNSIAGSYRGRDQVLDYFRRRRELAQGTLRLHPGELLAGERHHLAQLTDGTAILGGTEHRWSTVGLYRVQAEQIAACWLLPLDPTAFDDVWSLPAASDPVLLLTGPPGAGKSTVARLLAGAHDQAVHVEADRFFRFVRGGYIEPWRPESHQQNAAVMEAVCAAADRYAAAGYFTIVEGILSPRWFLDPVWRGLADRGHTVACAILGAPLDACLARTAGREPDRLSDPAVVAQLWRQFDALGELETHRIDTGGVDAESVAQLIRTQLNATLLLS